MFTAFHIRTRLSLSLGTALVFRFYSFGVDPTTALSAVDCICDRVWLGMAYFGEPCRDKMAHVHVPR